MSQSKAVCVYCLRNVDYSSGSVLWNFSDQGWTVRRCRPGYRYSWRCHKACHAKNGAPQVDREQLDVFVKHCILLFQRTKHRHMGAERPWACHDGEWSPSLEFKKGCAYNTEHDTLTRQVRLWSQPFLPFASRIFGNYVLRRTNNIHTFESMRSKGLLDLQQLREMSASDLVAAFEEELRLHPPQMAIRGIRSRRAEALTMAGLSRCLDSHDAVAWLEQRLKSSSPEDLDAPGDMKEEDHGENVQGGEEETVQQDAFATPLVQMESATAELALQSEMNIMQSAWSELIQCVHCISTPDAIWRFFCAIPGQGGSGFRCGLLCADLPRFGNLLVCGPGSMVPSMRVVHFLSLDSSSKMTRFFPSDAKRMKQSVSALEHRLQYLRVLIIHSQVRSEHFLQKYGAAALNEIFRDPQSTQFLLCECGKTLSPTKSPWYHLFKEEPARQKVVECAERRGLRSIDCIVAKTSPRQCSG